MSHLSWTPLVTAFQYLNGAAIRCICKWFPVHIVDTDDWLRFTYKLLPPVFSKFILCSLQKEVINLLKKLFAYIVGVVKIITTLTPSAGDVNPN